MNQKDPYLQKNHSLPYLKMAFLSDKHEIMENPDGYGKRTGVCGDTVEMFIRVRNERIQSVTFITNGCINTYACANTVALLAEGKTINKAWEITPEKVANYLKTLPKEDLHCAELAAGALYLAMVKYREYKNYPWKKPNQQRFR
jgi:nitrogen fixation NifU-like protein